MINLSKPTTVSSVMTSRNGSTRDRGSGSSPSITSSNGSSCRPPHRGSGGR